MAHTGVQVLRSYPMVDYEENICSLANTEAHYEGLIHNMRTYAHEGNYVDLMHTMWQRGHLVSNRMGLKWVWYLACINRVFLRMHTCIHNTCNAAVDI
jgi:hypothetical protein